MLSVNALFRYNNWLGLELLDVSVWQILRTIPFHEVDVSVLSVEYIHGRTAKQSYVDFMTRRGYRLHKDIRFHDPAMSLFVDDFIFVKKTLPYR